MRRWYPMNLLRALCPSDYQPSRHNYTVSQNTSSSLGTKPQSYTDRCMVHDIIVSFPKRVTCTTKTERGKGERESFCKKKKKKIINAPHHARICLHSSSPAPPRRFGYPNAKTTPPALQHAATPRSFRQSGHVQLSERTQPPYRRWDETCSGARW